MEMPLNIHPSSRMLRETPFSFEYFSETWKHSWQSSFIMIYWVFSTQTQKICDCVGVFGQIWLIDSAGSRGAQNLQLSFDLDPNVTKLIGAQKYVSNCQTAYSHNITTTIRQRHKWRALMWSCLDFGRMWRVIGGHHRSAWKTDVI